MTKTRSEVSDDARDTAANWCARIADGPLTQADRDAFHTWLEADAAHSALFERTVAAWQALEDQAGEPELIMMRGEALENVRQASGRRWARKFNRWRPIAAVAASLILFLIAGLWWHFVPTTYETGVGERRVVALSDGSTVSLDAATRVDVRYGGGQRQFWLRTGRAKFNVARDPLRPFSVQANDRMVVATGTQFSVESLPDQVRVVLYEGRVSVFDTSRDRPQLLAIDGGRRLLHADQALLPGRELVVSTSAPDAAIAPVDVGSSLAWEAGLIQFHQESLSTAIARMNRYSAVKLRAGDARAARTLISGQFVGTDADAFVEGVTAVFPLNATRTPAGEIVLSAR